MKLSIIIVNYNVKYFIEQCLYSVLNAIKNIETEIFVVDNNSVDGSVAMIREKFPQIHLIENKKNTGFSYANNQAIKLAKGQYILLLNPDTVVEEDTFEKTIAFMDKQTDAGGLGVKMIDGKGNFLPESKRALPTPMVAFYKIFGFSKLFPKSKKFGRYHLGFLNKDEIHEVEVLSGAFMLLRAETINKIGMLDEDYFMYGEDIDLSYRIIKGGYKNYYYPKTTIIHYKGESTKKGSINYVKVFYNAMIIFAQKHFTAENAKLFSTMIKTAIYFRALLAIIARFIKEFSLPLLDASIIYIGFYLIKPFWEMYKFHAIGAYPNEFLKYIVPSYVLLWVATIFFSGGYEKPAKIWNVLKGIVTGSFVILVIYSLLSEELRFSRALILIGSVWTIISLTAIRFLLHKIKFKSFAIAELIKRKKIIIIGKFEECNRVFSLIKQTTIKPELIGFVSPCLKEESSNFIGNIDQLEEIIEINKVDEIIFCAKDISTQSIIKNMLSLSDEPIDYKIASPDSISIIGSNSINTSGDLYTIDINTIAKAKNRRNKRIFDVFLAILLIPISPVIMFLVEKPKNLLHNILLVLWGSKSWVGYYTQNNTNIFSLPKIKKGVLSAADTHKEVSLSAENIDKLNILYAKDYMIFNDFLIIVKAARKLDR